MAPLFLFLTDIFTHEEDFTDTLQKIICSVVVVCGELMKSPEATHPFGGQKRVFAASCMWDMSVSLIYSPNLLG